MTEPRKSKAILKVVLGLLMFIMLFAMAADASFKVSLIFFGIVCVLLTISTMVLGVVYIVDLIQNRL